MSTLFPNSTGFSNNTGKPGLEARRRQRDLLRFRAELAAEHRVRRRQFARSALSKLKLGSGRSTADRLPRIEAVEAPEALR